MYPLSSHYFILWTFEQDLFTLTHTSSLPRSFSSLVLSVVSLSHNIRPTLGTRLLQGMMMKVLRLWVTLFVFCSWASVESLSSKATKSRQKPIERVAIIGSGIAGLSLAHALTNSPTLSDGSQGKVKVSLYDSRRSFDYSLGAGVQLNGGMAVLGKMNSDLQQAVIDASVPISTIKARNKSWFGDSADKLWDMSIGDCIRNAGGSVSDELIVNGKVMWYGIMRGALQETLMEKLPADSNQVSFDKNLVGIQSCSDGGAMCEFSDGSTAGPFDLIVGCDGIKSAIKEYIETKKISDDPSKSAAGIYSGIRIRYAIQDGDPTEEQPPSYGLKSFFGDGAFALSGIYGNGIGRPPAKAAFIISLDDDYFGPFKRKEAAKSSAVSENADWSQDNKKPVVDTRQGMTAQVSRHNLIDDDIAPTVAKADRFFDLGVYFHNPISLSGWSKEIPSSQGTYAVLCGDSAHAMPPFLGQGSNQAVQDAYCLAKKVYEFNALAEGRWVPVDDQDEPKDLRKLLKEYENIRWKPTTSITVKAAILGYLETGGPDGFYAKFRDVFFKTLSTLGIATKVLLGAATPNV